VDWAGLGELSSLESVKFSQSEGAHAINGQSYQQRQVARKEVKYFGRERYPIPKELNFIDNQTHERNIDCDSDGKENQGKNSHGNPSKDVELHTLGKSDQRDGEVYAM
jgi:hypothetical protein